jgi:excisionase family DNA binding protein
MTGKIEEREWRSTGEVASLCGATTQTVRRWIDTGKLPSAIFGKARRIKRTDAEMFVDYAIERGKKSA